MNKPLQFLGLYKTHHNASSREEIPALVVSGDSSEEQILVAGERYLHRPAVMQSVLTDLVRVIRYEHCKDPRRCLDILLLVMERHPNEKHIQVSASAGLYYILQTDRLKREWNVKVKRRILKALLDAMINDLGDQALMHNGCLILCQFQIPSDVMFDYRRLVPCQTHLGIIIQKPFPGEDLAVRRVRDQQRGQLQSACRDLSAQQSRMSGGHRAQDVGGQHGGRGEDVGYYQ